MTVSTADNATPWLLLVFSLPARNASQRVDVWRKLRRYGVFALKSSGYVLPKNAVNEERLEWLASEIRKHKGNASVLKVASIDDLPSPELERLFNQARESEYKPIVAELQKLARSKTRPAGVVTRLRRRFLDIADRDFFNAPSRGRVEQLLSQIDPPEAAKAASAVRRRKDYLGKTWLTRPRPGIDRVSSAWLIRRFIDSNATFAF